MTFAPILIIIVGLIFFVGAMVELDNNPGRFDRDFPVAIIVWIVAIFLSIGISIGMTIYFAIHASKNQHVAQSMRTAWVLINVFGGTIAHAIYFFMHVVPLKPGEQTTHYQHYS